MFYFILFWVALAIIAAVIDIVTSNLLYVLFSVGSVVALVLALFGFSFLIQLSVFCIITAALFIFLYPIVRRAAQEKIPRTKTMEESYIGNCFVFNDDLKKGNLVKYKGIYWTMVPNGSENEIQKGDMVRVIGIDGNKLIIEKYYYNKTI